MLDDAVKEKELEEEVEVADLAPMMLKFIESVAAKTQIIEKWKKW
jgi:hypothetical protein